MPGGPEPARSGLSLCILLGRLTGLLLVAGLAACGEAVTSTPFNNARTIIPTFTPVPSTTTAVPTASPTLIVVPPTATMPPTPTPAPTATVPPTPTLTVAPTLTRSPTPTIPSGFQVISPDQARNLNGYRALLPAYLPPGFRLTRLSFFNNSAQQLLTVLSEYADQQGRTFAITAQVGPVPPTSAPTTTPDIAATLTVNATAGVSNSNPTPTPTLSPTPRATLSSATFQQESVNVRGQAALLSSGNDLASLGWSEGRVRYFINGALSREDILKVAASLQ